jgi:transglutaminase-like putative cysteine protease
MKIRLGCEMTYAFAQVTPMIVMLNVHHSQIASLESPDRLTTIPAVPIEGYHDVFGNWCSRLVAPVGDFTLHIDSVIRDQTLEDAPDLDAVQHPVEDLPPETLMYLLGSRYCETDHLSDEAWRLFGDTPPNGARVQAIVDFVHRHITFDYGHSNPLRTAAQAYVEGRGVCRDFAHLAVAFCRCMNIPTRYCTGYISFAGTPLPHADGDYAAWIEVYLGGRWHVFDPRNNARRTGRVMVAYGRDAADVPLTHTFGPNNLTGFRVWADEVPE